MASSASSPAQSDSSDHYSGFLLGEGVGRTLSVSDALAELVARLRPRRPDVTVDGQPWVPGADVDPDDYPGPGYYGADDHDDDRAE